MKKSNNGNICSKIDPIYPEPRSSRFWGAVWMLPSWVHTLLFRITGMRVIEHSLESGAVLGFTFARPHSRNVPPWVTFRLWAVLRYQRESNSRQTNGDRA